MKAKLIILYCAVIAFAYGDQRLTDWLASYYLTKDDSRLSENWDRMVGQGALERLAAPSREILIGFLGAVMRTHPEFLRSRVSSISQYPEKQRLGIARILWLSQTTYGRKLLMEGGFPEMATKPCPLIANFHISSDDDYSFLQGWYYATGDVRTFEPFFKRIESGNTQEAAAASGFLGAMCLSDQRANACVQAMIDSGRFSGDARTIIGLRLKVANHALLPTATTVTSPAEQEARRP